MAASIPHMQTIINLCVIRGFHDEETEVVALWAAKRHVVVLWLEINVSEAGLPPSSGLNFVVKEMYPLQCCLPTEVPYA